MAGLIYNYLKEHLGILTKHNVREYHDKLNEAEQDIKKLRQELTNDYRYCLGCKDFVKRAEAYEDEYKGKAILRCCNCDAIIEFPEKDAYLV